MDEFLSDAGSKALHMAVRSSVSFASSYALKKISRAIDDQINKTIVHVVDSVQLPGSSSQLADKKGIVEADTHNINILKNLRDEVNYKIDIVLHTLDLIQTLYKNETEDQYKRHVTKSSDLVVRSCSRMMQPLVNEVTALGDQIENLKTTDEFYTYMKKLSTNIDSVIPYMTLCLNVVQGSVESTVETLGIKTSNGLSIQDRDVLYSPSLLLEAANIVFSLKQGTRDKNKIGVTDSNLEFEATVFNLVSFSPDAKKPVWQESIRRCIVSFDLSDDPAEWKICLTQSLDDGLYHDLEEETNTSQGERQIPLKSVAKSYYNFSSHLLNIEENHDVLVLKVLKGNTHEDFKWVAFCKYSYEEASSDSDEDDSDEDDEQDDTDEQDSEGDDFQSLRETIQRHQSIKLLQYVLGVLKHELLFPHDTSSTDDHLKMCLMGQYVHTKFEDTIQKEIETVTEKVQELGIKN